MPPADTPAHTVADTAAASPATPPAKTFTAIAEPRPGAGWQADFRANWPGLRAWYLKQGLEARPSEAEGLAALRRWMPELLPIYERVAALAGDDPVARRCLTLWNPPPVIVGCSQGIWLGPEGPALVRNYDFDPDLCEGRVEMSAWFGRRCIVMADAAWGCLDGMNEAGLVASLTFGGRPAQGIGFPVLLVLRYLLETCESVEAAAAVLARVPVTMAQNVTLLDRAGRHVTLFLGADRAPARSQARAITNHQEAPVWPAADAAGCTVQRQAAVAGLLAGEASLDGVAAAFLRPPLYNLDFAGGFVTLYSAVYRPAEGVVDYLWPGHRWRQGFADFRPGRYTHRYAPPG